jgi:hypothetical protein
MAFAQAVACDWVDVFLGSPGQSRAQEWNDHRIFDFEYTHMFYVFLQKGTVTQPSTTIPVGIL